MTVLGILLNFGLDAGHNQDKFPKTLIEKKLKFVLSKKNSIIVFDLGLILLQAKIDLIAEEHSWKRHGLAFVASIVLK